MPHRIPLGDVPPGETRTVVVDNEMVAVCNVEGRIYAIEGVCPHAGGPLGDGFLKGNVLTCPWHGWSFDVSSGACTFSPEISLERYQTMVVSDQIEIRLEPADSPQPARSTETDPSA